MKKSFLLIILSTILSNFSNAQWYDKSCGVTDINSITSEEFECLWDQAKKTVHNGQIITVIGAAGIGGTILLTTLWLGTEIDGDFWTALTALSIAAGVVGIILGPTIWIVGATRKSKLKKTSSYYTYKPGNLRLNPSIFINQFNNTHSYGITFSFTF